MKFIPIIQLKVYFILILFTSFGCENSIKKGDVIGTYSGNFKKSYDTIIVQDNNIYKRMIYSENGKLFFQNTGEWNYVEGSILFNDYLLNGDRLLEDIEYKKMDLTNAKLPIENSTKSIKIIENYDKNHFFRKIE